MMKARAKEELRQAIVTEVRGLLKRQREAKGWPKSYEWPKSPSGKWVLSKDGRDLMTGTDSEIYAYLHRVQSGSVDWALKYEGYKVRPATESVQERAAEQRFTIMYDYKPGPHGPEEIDTAETEDEARRLLAEYELAYRGQAKDTELWIEDASGRKLR